MKYLVCTVTNIIKLTLKKLGYGIYPLNHEKKDRLSNYIDSSTYNKILEENVNLLKQNDITKVHYACGLEYFDKGWVNIDVNNYGKQPTKPFILVNLVNKHPLPSNYFQYAYFQDFIEHLTQADSIIFLTEVYRCLK